MASKYISISGTFMWAKVKTPDQKFDVYTLDLYPTDEGWDKFHASGLQLKVRENDEGDKYVKVRRPVSKVIKGEVIDMGPPTVKVLEDGVYVAYDGLVGNGSTGIVNLRTYETTKGTGHELTAVAVDSLVEYGGAESDGDFPF